MLDFLTPSRPQGDLILGIDSFVLVAKWYYKIFSALLHLKLLVGEEIVFLLLCIVLFRGEGGEEGGGGC